MFRIKIIILSLMVIYNLPVYAAGIKGKVVINQQAARKPSGLSALYKKDVTTTPAAAQSDPMAVLFIKDFPGSEQPDPVENAAIAQKNMTFHPNILTITVGTEVAFPNMDMIYHNVFSLSETKEFDLGRYEKGKSKSVLFDKSGIVEVFCEIHSHMHAYIIVVPNKYYCLTRDDGSFEIMDIPPGKYTLVAWSKKHPVKEIPVTVTDNEDLELTIEF